MEPHFESIYLDEIGFHLANSLRRVNELNALLRALHEKRDMSVIPSIFGAIQAILVHGANVSKTLCPAPRGATAKRDRALSRGEHLRTALGVDENDLVLDRDFRDAFEHYDERLDEWSESSPFKNIIVNCIGSRSAIGGEAVRDEDIFRMFDPATKTLWFRGLRLDLQAYVDALSALNKKVASRQGKLERIRFAQLPQV